MTVNCGSLSQASIWSRGITSRKRVFSINNINIYNSIDSVNSMDGVNGNNDANSINSVNLVNSENGDAFTAVYGQQQAINS